MYTNVPENPVMPKSRSINWGNNFRRGSIWSLEQSIQNFVSTIWNPHRLKVRSIFNIFYQFYFQVPLELQSLEKCACNPLFFDV